MFLMLRIATRAPAIGLRPGLAVFTHPIVPASRMPTMTTTRLRQLPVLGYRSFAQMRVLRAVSPKTGRVDPQEAMAAHHGKYLFPARIPIYHIGTGRFTFIAVMKLTTIVLCAFFCGIAVPSYVVSDQDVEKTLGLGLCGVIPLLVVLYTTTPAVAFLHLHLPAAARTSRDTLRRYVHNMPPTAQIDITTLSPIAKPRTTTVEARALRVAVPPRRLGLVNFVRTPDDVARENAQRRWWRFRAVAHLHIAGPNRGIKEAWIWDELRTRLERIAANEQKQRMLK